jgi:hypothetical protein
MQSTSGHQLNSQQTRVRFHAHVSASAAAAQVLILYGEGADAVITLGAGDRIVLDSAALSGATGISTLFFRAAAGAFDPESVVLMLDGVTNIGMAYPNGRTGNADDLLFVISDGANVVSAQVTGWIILA